MTTIEEVQALAVLMFQLRKATPTDPTLLARWQQWTKQVATQLKEASKRLDDATT